MQTFFERLLSVYNLSNEDYLYLTREVSKNDLESQNNFKNIDKAVDRIKNAIDNNEKIMIYGDYDCDGITSTSILVYTFKKMNYGNVGYYIPSRYLDGYGINEAMVDVINSKGYKLIITVDNGVAQFDALRKAKEYGIDVILTDHHEMKDELPDNYTIIHPFLKENDSKLAECGAYVAFNLSRALLNETDDYLLSLACLATISDMMPLKGYNRDLVRVGIETIRRNGYYQFMYLLGQSGMENEKSLSFGVAPKINALGRVLENRQVNKGVEYFVSDDKNQVSEIGKLIEYVNEKRKVISNEAVKKIDYSKYEDKIFIIDRFDDICEGLIGLIANKALNEANKPCIIFTKDNKTGYLKGSARSLEGLPLNELFSKMPELIVQFGGHAFAGGIAIKEENLSSFIEKINEISKEYTIVPKKKLIINCNLDDLNMDNYQMINTLAPFGEEFEEPYLMIEYPCKNVGYLSNGKHIKGIVNPKCTFVGFNMNKDFGKTGSIKLIGKLTLDSFRGNGNLSFIVDEVIQ